MSVSKQSTQTIKHAHLPVFSCLFFPRTWTTFQRHASRKQRAMSSPSVVRSHLLAVRGKLTDAGNAADRLQGGRISILNIPIDGDQRARMKQFEEAIVDTGPTSLQQMASDDGDFMVMVTETPLKPYQDSLRLEHLQKIEHMQRSELKRLQRDLDDTLDKKKALKSNPGADGIDDIAAVKEGALPQATATPNNDKSKGKDKDKLVKGTCRTLFFEQ